MEEKTRAIVLRTVKYGEHSLIIEMLTRNAGRQSVVWKIPKSGKGKIKRQYFQVLTILDVIFDLRPSASLPLLKDARIAETYTDIPYNMVKQSVAFFLAEFLSIVAKGEQIDTHLFDFVESSLLWFDMKTNGIANFHIMFMVRISLFLGFYPNLEEYTPYSYFDLRAAQFTESVPVHRDFLSQADTHNFVNIMRITPANMHVFRFSQAERNSTIEWMLRFYAFHIPGFRELKSWQVLREVFS